MGNIQNDGCAVFFNAGKIQAEVLFIWYVLIVIINAGIVVVNVSFLADKIHIYIFLYNI